VLEYRPDQPYDYVVASGLFGLEAEGARERIVPTLERMFGWAGRGVAANFLSALSPVPVEARVYIEPVEGDNMDCMIRAVILPCLGLHNNNMNKGLMVKRR
jgi:hypothetical protein